MSQVLHQHRQAMERAAEADAARRAGDEETVRRLLRAAFELERSAAEQVVAQVDAEPTRSVLLRSAASLAVECREYREAERLIATALSGEPPEEICDELRDLLEELYDGTELRRAGR